MAADPVAEDPKKDDADAASTPTPAEDKPGKPSQAGFGRRLQIGTNVIVQIVLFAFIVTLVNAYAFKHYHKFDFTRDRKTALSERTKQFLRSLTKPVKMIVCMSSQSQLQGDVANLAAEYRDAQSKFINLEIVDTYRNYTRAVEIQSRYKLGQLESGQLENAVILDCEGRTKVIGDNKMAEYDRSGEMMGQPATVTAFTGEQAITSGLLEVYEGKKSNVYYVQGHGEPAVAKGKPLENVSAYLESEHLTGAELNLLNVETVPPDATVVMLMGARYDLTEREVKLLSDYWDKGGRLLLLLNPDAQTPHLAAFLARLGIRPDDDRILQTLNLGNMTGIVRDVLGQFEGDTLIAKRLAGLTPVFPGGTQSLTLTPESGAATNTKLQRLLVASKGFWGETEYQDLTTAGAYHDVGKDKEAPLYIAATVEKGALGDQRVQVGAARMIVVGNSKFVEIDAMDDKLAAFFVSSMNWLLEREALIGVAPKQIKTFTLNLPDEQTRQLFWIVILAIPAFCAFLGVVVWWWRRRS